MWKKFIKLIIFIVCIQKLIGQCTHPIFCSPPVLEAIAQSNIFKDSKTFVDLVLKVPVETALSNFRSKNVFEFVRDSFHSDPNVVLQSVQFQDFNPSPSFLQKINDPELVLFGKELNRRWDELGKKVVLGNAQKIGTCKQRCTSYLPELDGRTLLVPGGRFRESYYWDTYWIILGLIASDMLDTAESILDTFANIIQVYGFIPNGLRQYYLNRSQPPFFFLMVKKVTEAWFKKGKQEKANSMQRKYFDILLKEHEYWEKTHSIKIKIESGYTFHVNQYNANAKTARPQSYRQDINTVSRINDPVQRDRVFHCLSSMAESGWDFSSRWLENSSDLTSTIIDKLVPTDLNTLLGLQQSYLIPLCTKYGRHDLFDYFYNRMKERNAYFSAIKKDGRFPDYRIGNESWKASSVYPTDYFPYILLSQTISLPTFYQDLVNPTTSNINTGQQWDKPNVWAPNNWILHEVTDTVSAYKLAQQWVKTTYCSWKKTGNLYQKYRNDAYGERGQGGQYQVQTGFGWTNGLALYYLTLYGDSLVAGSC